MRSAAQTLKSVQSTSFGFTGFDAADFIAEQIPQRLRDQRREPRRPLRFSVGGRAFHPLSTIKPTRGEGRSPPTRRDLRSTRFIATGVRLSPSITPIGESATPPKRWSRSPLRLLAIHNIACGAARRPHGAFAQRYSLRRRKIARGAPAGGPRRAPRRTVPSRGRRRGDKSEAAQNRKTADQRQSNAVRFHASPL